MPPKEQTVVDERGVRREKRDQAKEQAAVKEGQRKEQKNTLNKGESLIGQRPSSSMTQSKLVKETDLENPEPIPTPEKDEEQIRVKEMEEEVATNSPIDPYTTGKNTLRA
eukprot:Gb_05736 [translate_table: standard]